MRGDGDTVEVGYVARAHGIRGELRVVAHNPDSSLIADVPRLVIGDESFEVEAARPVKGAYLVRLAGLRDRNRAEALRGLTVSVDRDLVPLDDGELLLQDLVGLQVVRAGGEPWGEVVGVELGPQDRLVIHHGEVERLLPVVDAYIVDIDLDGGVIEVDPPDGWPEAPARRSR
jgi:16S rRNA processing protein RimM